MAYKPRWKDLAIGLLAIAGILAAGLGTLVFARVGVLHGKKFIVYVSLNEARGVIRGTEVWLDGQKVGLVKNIDFAPPTTKPNDRLVLTLSVLESARPHIRMDTRVDVRAGSSIIGDKIVYLSSGTAAKPVVGIGDTVRAGEQPDYEAVGSNVAFATREFPAIISNVKLMGAELTAVDATLGALIGGEGGADMRRVREQTDRLLERLRSSNGTFGMAFDGRSELRQRAERANAEVDSLRALLASNEHSLGRFRRDSTLRPTLARMRAELEDLRVRAADPNGTIGRARADSAIVRNIHRDLAALDSLIADMKKHPLRYNPF